MNIHNDAASFHVGRWPKPCAAMLYRKPNLSSLSPLQRKIAQRIKCSPNAAHAVRTMPIHTVHDLARALTSQQRVDRYRVQHAARMKSVRYAFGLINEALERRAKGGRGSARTTARARARAWSSLAMLLIATLSAASLAFLALAISGGAA